MSGLRCDAMSSHRQYCPEYGYRVKSITIASAILTATLSLAGCGSIPSTGSAGRAAPASAEAMPPTPAGPGSLGEVGNTALPPCCKK
jgi:hypothetical protein